MNVERWKKIEMLCYEAEGMDKAERDSYLQNSCGNDKELLAEVKSLLNQSDSERLQQPFVDIQSSSVFSDKHSLSNHKIGPYRIIRTIASGGMGKIYLGVRDDDQFERFVALKVIRKELVSGDVLSRFYEERQILASLNHPNIARLFDGGMSDGMPWFAMEYVEGKPITEYCKLHNLTVEEKLNLFLKVCSTVQYAHQNLVIHRDLKPANIFITPEGTPKLLDFGIAKLMSLEHKPGQTQYQKQMMTPEYASPEQVRNESISTVSDVYSLGVLLYELLSGTLPYQFEKQTPAAIEQTICNTIPKQLSIASEIKTLKGDLDSVTMKALRKEPSERYTSVEQFAEDLRRYKNSLPVLARKESVLYSAKKFLYRHKWGVSASTLIALLIIAFSVVTFIQSQTIEARAVEAEKERDRAEEVSNFLTELFESADPSEAENKSLTAVELVHRGADRVKNELNDQPYLQSSLLLVISDVYESLGLYDEGLDLAKNAYNLQKDLYGPKHAEIARSLNLMGWLHRQKGNYEHADSLLTAALTMRQDLLGGQHLDVARSLNDLAVLKQSRGEYTATDTLLSEAIKIRKALAGEQHESVAVALSNYAALKWRLGDLAAAEDYMEEALNMFLKTLGKQDLRVAVAMTNLAAIRLTRGESKEVEKLYRQALEIRLQLLDEEHPAVAYSYAHLGNFLRARGEYDEAEDYLTKAHNLRVKLFGTGHVLVGDSKRVLGFFYEKVGKYEKAKKFYIEAIDTFQLVFPDGHARTAEVSHTLGELYLSMGNNRKAVEPLQEALSIRRQIFGEDDIRTAASMIKLGICFAEEGDHAQARSLLADGLKILENSNQDSDELKKLAGNTLAKL